MNCNCCSYCTNFNPTAELAIPSGIPINKAKAEIKMQPMTAETKIRKRSK